MAHIQKCKLANAGLGYHFSRASEAHSNPSIDPERTRYNQTLYPTDRPAEWASRPLRANVEARIAEALEGRRPRRDAVAFFVLTVTAPRNLREGDGPAFARAAYSFAMERFGPANVMPGYLHCDETTDHIHIPIVPITPDGRLCYGDVMPRSAYKRLHIELGEYVDARLGYHADVLLPEDERARKALSHVPQGELAAAERALDEKLGDRVRALDDAGELVRGLRAEAEALRAEKSELEQGIRGLEERLRTLVERVREFVRDYLLPPFDAAHAAIKERGIVEFFEDLDEAEQEFFNDAREISRAARQMKRERER